MSATTPTPVTPEAGWVADVHDEQDAVFTVRLDGHGYTEALGGFAAPDAQGVWRLLPPAPYVFVPVWAVVVPIPGTEFLDTFRIAARTAAIAAVGAAAAYHTTVDAVDVIATRDRALFSAAPVRHPSRKEASS